MNKYDSRLIKQWEDLKRAVSLGRESITSIDLYNNLRDWTHLLKESPLKEHSKYYELSFSFFEGIRIEEYEFSVTWYSLADLIKYSLLNYDSDKISRLAGNCGKMMLEILVFKTNILCPNCTDDNLRAFTDLNEHEVYLNCDICDYSKDINGKRVYETHGRWRPLKPWQQVEFRLMPSPV